MRNFFALLLFSSSVAFSQDCITYNGETINCLDDNNEKTGIWKAFNENTGLLVMVQFENGKYASNTTYYKDAKLIASYDNEKYLYIFKDQDTIRARFKREDDKRLTIIDDAGVELNEEIRKFYFLNSAIQPMPYGGFNTVYEFIRKNKNPKIKNKGKVVVEFYIDADGFTSDVAVKSSENKALNEEALRLIRSLPRWQPGHQKGIFVKAKYSVPISF
jgi:TonB family protein